MSYVAVSFEHFDEATKRHIDVTMPLAEAQAYQHRTHEWVSYVWFEATANYQADGPAVCFRSFAKSLIHGNTTLLAHIAGGSGNCIARFDQSDAEKFIGSLMSRVTFGWERMSAEEREQANAGWSMLKRAAIRMAEEKAGVYAN